LGVAGPRELANVVEPPLDLSPRGRIRHAFEATSLQVLGDAARSRNHREIVQEWRTNDPAAYDAVRDLAELYEQARYAPPGGTLDEAAVQRAEADRLTLLGSRFRKQDERV
jgi:hypothetical protein